MFNTCLFCWLLERTEVEEHVRKRKSIKRNETELKEMQGNVKTWKGIKGIEKNASPRNR